MIDRDFEVGKHMLKEECLVCKEKLRLGEKIILCPIQGVKEGWGNVMSIPIHTKCYWVEDDDD